MRCWTWNSGTLPRNTSRVAALNVGHVLGMHQAQQVLDRHDLVVFLQPEESEVRAIDEQVVRA